MLRRISIDELQRANVGIRFDEAIAITQQLIHSCANGGAQPPYGAPTPLNVFIDGDGTVTCVGSDATFAVSEVGRFLHAMLSLEVGRVPGAVRYTVARALLEVDAPPFDSLDDFSEALARYERIDRQVVIGALLQRARSTMAGLTGSSVPATDRRRTAANIAELRRQLRDADARVYDQQRALDALGAMAATGSPKRARRFALAAGVAAGLALIGVGEGMPWHTSDADTVLVLPARSQAPKSALEPAALPSDADIVLADAKAVPTHTPSRKPSVQRRESKGGNPERVALRSPRKPHRLRMNWLRTKIAIRHDAL